MSVTRKAQRASNRLDATVENDDRRVGPSRLSTWSGRRILSLWLLWPATVVAICAVAVFMSVRIHGDFTEVRVDLTRSNLIGLGAVLLLPPACLTMLWRRMRGRRHAPSPS